MLEISNKLIWVPREAGMQNEVEFIKEQIAEMGLDGIANIVDVAVKCRDNASTKNKVGVAAYAKNRKIYGGCNFESVDAITFMIQKANSEGAWKTDPKYIKSLVVCHDGSSNQKQKLLNVFNYSDNCLIIDASPERKIRRITSLLAIFPPTLIHRI